MLRVRRFPQSIAVSDPTNRSVSDKHLHRSKKETLRLVVWGRRWSLKSTCSLLGVMTISLTLGQGNRCLKRVDLVTHGLNPNIAMFEEGTVTRRLEAVVKLLRALRAVNFDRTVLGTRA